MNTVARVIASILLIGAAPLSVSRADSDAVAVQDALSRIEQQLTAISERLTRLEALMPSYTQKMPEMAERLHIMHAAGDAGDWALASHELLVLKSLIAQFEAIDAGKGSMMRGFLTKPFDDLANAIDHGNAAKFKSSLDETVKSCNACHTAVGSEFMRVTLDTSTGATLRHPHVFTESKGDHTHAH